MQGVRIKEIDMCCSPRLETYETNDGPDGECPTCGEPTYNGYAEGCAYSPVECDDCGYSPCDGSC